MTRGNTEDFLTRVENSGLVPFFDSVQCGIWDWNLVSGAMHFTSQCERFLGYEGNELPRRYETLVERLHPDDKVVVQLSVEAILAGREAHGNREFRLLHKNGSYIWIQERFAVSKLDGEGRPEIITGMIYDITQIKQAELHERAERRHIEEVKRITGLGAWEWDLRRDFVSFTENSAHIVGRPLSDMNGPFDNLARLLPAQQFMSLKAGYEEYLTRNDGSVFVMELSPCDTRGRALWIRNIANVVEWDEEGRPVKLRGGILDISETVTAQNNLKIALETIDRYNKQLETDVQQARRTINAMFSANPQVNILFNDQIQVVDCNPAAAELFDVKDTQAFLALANSIHKGQKMSTIVTVLRSHFQKAMETGRRDFSAEFTDRPTMNAVMKRIEYGGSPAVVLYLTERSETEERIQLMLDSMPLACMLIDEDHKIIDSNKTLLDTIGVDAKQMHREHRWDFYPEFQPDGSNSVQVIRQHIERAFETGRADFDWTFQTVSGVPLPMSVTLVRAQWRDSDCLICFGRDMREVLAEQERVREAEAYTQLMLDSTPLICSVWSEDGRMIDCNMAALSYFELKSKEEYIEHFYDLSPEYQADGTPTKQLAAYYIDKTLKTGWQRFSWQYQTATGKPLPVETTLIRADWHGEHRILAYSQDLREIISEREKAREAEAYTQLMLDSTPIICAVWDENGTVIDCNLEAVRLFGLENKEEYISHFYSLNPVFQPDGVPSEEKANRMVANALETGFERFEWEFETNTGESLPVDVMLVRVPWKNGYRVLSYSRDLRPIKKANAAINRYTVLLKTVNQVAEELMAATTEDFNETIAGQLKALGEAVGADRVYVWENFPQDGSVFYRQTIKWASDPSLAELIPAQQEMCYDQLPYLKESIFASQTINSLVRDLPREERELCQRQGAKSALMVPIQVGGEVWGFITFDNCVSEVISPDIDTGLLKSSGILIASAIIQNRMTANLITAGQELRVGGRLLGAVNLVAERLLASGTDDFTRVQQECLEILGRSVEANRVSLWRNFEDENGRLCSARLPGWIEGQTYQESAAEGIIDFASYVPEWDQSAEVRKDIDLPMRYMNEALRNMAILQNSNSLLLVHIEIDGEFWGFLGFAHDHDERIQDHTEISILRSGGMMLASAIMRNEINRKLVIATDEALASVRAKNEFLARMSHEIRTPLNAVIGMTTVAQRSQEPEKIQECLDVTASSAKQLLAIINDILDMSNIDLDKLEIMKSPYDFEQMLSSTINAFLPLFEEKRQHFQYDFEQALDRMVIGDEKRTAQIISNLLSNAIKFTPGGGNITLRIRQSGQGEDTAAMTIQVIDDGIGISESFLPRLFAMFEQADGGITRKYGGVGLGLPICKKLVQLMDGDIEVKSQPGEGSCFTVTIPVTFGGPCVARADKTALRSDLRILVVDDMPDVLSYFTNILASFSLGCETEDTVRAAVHKLHQADTGNRPYDIVFLDWYLEDGSGIEVVTQVEALVHKPEIVIMSIADWSTIAHAVEGMDSLHFLPKPLLPSDIFNKLVELTYDPGRGSSAAEFTTAPDWRGKQVLLVEDIEINQLIAMELMADTGVEVTCAENGQQALEMFEAEPERFDLILMDMQMPVLDGLSAARLIRASAAPTAKAVPIYAMTANAFKEDAEACIEAGMNGHIPKPIDIDVLFRAMGEAFRSRR